MISNKFLSLVLLEECLTRRLRTLGEVVSKQMRLTEVLALDFRLHVTTGVQRRLRCRGACKSNIGA